MYQVCQQGDASGVVVHKGFPWRGVQKSGPGVMTTEQNHVRCAVLCNMLQPIIYYFAQATDADPIPFLTAMFTAANIWSMLLFVGEQHQAAAAPYHIHMALEASLIGRASACLLQLCMWHHMPPVLTAVKHTLQCVHCPHAEVQHARPFAQGIHCAIALSTCVSCAPCVTYPPVCRQPHKHHCGHGLQAELPGVQQMDGSAHHRCASNVQLLTNTCIIAASPAAGTCARYKGMTRLLCLCDVMH